MEKVIAIIPARGGSKGLPGKNIRKLAGKPLISWSIDAARKSGIFSRIIVSTDDPKIASISKMAGAELPFLRPANLALDNTPSWKVIIHALEWLEKNEGFQAD